MLKLTGRILLFLILAVAALLFWVLGTASGTQWTLQQASSQVSALNIEGIEGRFFDGVEIQRLSYQSGDTSVNAKTLLTAWDPSCLLQKKLCLNNIDVESLSLTLPPPTETAEPAPSDAPFSLPPLPLALDLQKARIGTLSWTQADTTQTIENIALSVQADSSSIQIRQASLLWQENKLSLDGQIELSANYPLDANLLVEVPNMLGPQTTELKLHAQGLLDGELALNASLTGHQQAQLKASLHALEKPLRLSGLLDAALLQSLETENQAVKLEELQLEFSGDLDQLKLATSSKISGAQLPDNHVDIAARLVDLAELHDLKLQLNALGGTALLQGQLGWQDSLHWQLQGDFKAIDVSQYRSDVQGKLSGELTTSGQQLDGEFVSPETTVTLRGTLQDRPLTADINITLAEQGHISLKKIELHSGENHLSAKGSIAQQLNIDAQLSAPDLASLWPGLGGSLHGEINASGSKEAPNISADLTGNSVLFQDLSIEQLSLQAKINNGAKANSTLTLSTRGLKASGLDNAELDADIQGTLAAHRLQLAASTAEQSAKLQLEGSLDQSDWNGTLASAQLAHQKQEISLEAPTALSWTADLAQASVAAHCWLWQKSRLCLEEDTQLSADSGDAQLALSNLQLQEFNPWLPENAKLAGTFEAALHGQWANGDKPTVSVNSKANKLSLKAQDTTGKQFSVNFTQMELSALLGEAEGHFDLQLSSPEQGDTSIQANIDPASKALSGSVDMQRFLLEPLQPLLPMLDTLRGELSAKGKFAGTLDDPQFKGRIELKNPALSGAQIPLTIDDGKLKLDIDGRKATLNAEFFAAPSGSLRISGDASYTDKLRASIALDGDELALILPPSIDATLNHSLTLAYTPEQLKLRGKVHVPDATIILEGLSGGGPTLSKDLVLTDEEDQPKQGQQQTAALQLDIDVEVQVDEDVRLSGYGFDTHLMGDIKVRQRIGQPAQLAGELVLKDGEYQAYGQDLEVRRGELLFVGPIRSTRVDVTAVRVVEQVEAGLMLSGDLMSPETTLFSEPAMADADVLSYIVLGGPPGQGGDESAILARAALGLGLKNGNRIAGQFASAAGIKDFNIGADGKGDNTAVVLSGRLSPKLLLSYRMGIFDAANTLTARYDLSQALYLELMRGVEQAIDLFYTVDY